MDRINRLVYRRVPGRNGGVVFALRPEAWFRFGAGITVTGAGVSQWNDASGNARHLLQGTDASRPALQTDGSILFDGTNDFLRVTFTLAQPLTAYLLMKQITWTANDYILDGALLASFGLQQKNAGASPQLALNAGATAITNADLVVGAYGVVTALLNGASSSITVNSGTPATGNPSAGSPNGLTLGATGDTTSTFANVQAKELIVFSSAHDAATQAKVVSYLRQLGGV